MLLSVVIEANLGLGWMFVGVLSFNTVRDRHTR